MSVAYRIAPRGGGITEHVIPPGGIDVGEGVTLLGGGEDEFWRTWTLDRVSGIVGRMAPWLTTWCGPKVMYGEESWGGRWSGQFDTITIKTDTGPNRSVATAYHECGHALDSYLLPDTQTALDDAAAVADWPGDYLSDPVERRARLIEFVCMSLDAGAVLHVEPGSATETAWACYTGELADQRDAAIAEAARLAAAPLPRPGIIRRVRELVHV